MTEFLPADILRVEQPGALGAFERSVIHFPDVQAFTEWALNVLHFQKWLIV